MKSVAEIFTIKPSYFVKQLPFDRLMHSRPNYADVVLPDLYVGVEVEVERAQPWNDQYGIWTHRGDGSLRNNGIEWVSYPLPGKAIPAAMAELFSGLNIEHQFSPRTSIHMHFDIRHLTLQQVAGICLAYLAVEPLLYKFVGNDRDKNVFCVPLFETGLVDDLVNFINRDLPGSYLENSRYAGLNLDAIRKFGTLEFRQLGGTDDINKIVRWMNLLMKVYEYGSTKQLGDTIRRISELNTNSYYISFINEIFGHLASYLDLTDIKADLEKGVKAVKQSSLSNELLNQLRGGFSTTSKVYKWYVKHIWGEDSLKKPRKELGKARVVVDELRPSQRLEWNSAQVVSIPTSQGVTFTTSVAGGQASDAYLDQMITTFSRPR